MFSECTLVANSAPLKAAEAIKAQGTTNYAATIYVNGTFDNGTVALYVSIDNGLTLIALKDSNGDPVTATTAEAFYITLGGGIGTRQDGNQVSEQIWAQITGAGSPSVKVQVNSNA